ncbi:MFS general substrate transporter [Aaosphaeria arxii CBS 175.79]|uniref:MFS general substrate transporter n=1 Tax=Aaosphaeria arxii CBS 175.79 TaxID=1450172 RepID=A0A6A5XDF2_9PLEO|nr:MFS general substrate transporter [Aaosphaeria arxii CBS 175.79]KAF2010893.1 MFS general substrate transporter [Aaosphaeria arxii CBS 175.79]
MPEQLHEQQSQQQYSTSIPGGTENKPAKPKLGGNANRFWGIFAALCILSFISALDVAIITTALPKITAEIGGATQYVWIANSFVVASSVLQPLVGQLANIFGRRSPLIVCVALFALGSGVSGGAHDPGMLVAGRTVQGVGAGGIYVLLDIVCCDLVPLRERGMYLGLMNSWAGVAAGIGPVVGGALADSNWRWIFYLNIPICGLALGVILLFMRLKTGAQENSIPKLNQIDYLGNLIFIPSMVALLYGLVTGGIAHPWSAWRIVLPLVIGIVGWISFHIQQLFTTVPSVPTRLFSNRTSATAYILTFTSSILVQALSYFLPVFFQAILGTTVLRSGTNLLPFALGTLIFAIIGGILLSKFGLYKPLHATAFALSALAFGLLTILNTTTARWVIFQLIASAGSGIILSCLLPAIMAALPESDVAAASALYSFIRTFGYIWGVTMPSIIFNGVFNNNLSVISQASLREQLKDGAAYAFASEMHRIRHTLDPRVLGEVEEVYMRSLRAIWWVGLGISIVSFFAVFVERGLELRKELETEYGLAEQDEGSKDNDREKSGGLEGI